MATPQIDFKRVLDWANGTDPASRFDTLSTQAPKMQITNFRHLIVNGIPPAILNICLFGREASESLEEEQIYNLIKNDQEDKRKDIMEILISYPVYQGLACKLLETLSAEHRKERLGRNQSKFLHLLIKEDAMPLAHRKPALGLVTRAFQGIEGDDCGDLLAARHPEFKTVFHNGSGDSYIAFWVKQMGGAENFSKLVERIIQEDPDDRGIFEDMLSTLGAEAKDVSNKSFGVRIAEAAITYPFTVRERANFIHGNALGLGCEPTAKPRYPGYKLAL